MRGRSNNKGGLRFPSRFERLRRVATGNFVIWETRTAMFGYFMVSIVWAMALVFVLLSHNTRADTLSGSRAPGTGTLIYSNSTTTPRLRVNNFGTSLFTSAATTTTARNPMQVVTKISPTRTNEQVMGIVDSGGTLEVLRSVDGGGSWTSGFTATMGGIGTTRRFDVGFEQSSGEIIVAYSKNATTNEIGIRRFTSSWQNEVTYDPSLTSAVVTWVELAEKRNSDELTLGYVTNALTNNLNMAVWNGSTNTFGSEPGAAVGTCDQTSATPDGIDKCFDVNYETGSGLPVVNWGISSLGNTTNTIRATRWSGSAWSTATISIGATGDDGTVVDCEANPETTSTEILCGSYGASTQDVQGWTTVAGTGTVMGLDRDTAAHAASAGRLFVAATYTVSNGNRKGIVTWADAVTTPSDNQLDYALFDGSAFATATTFSKTYGDDENLLAVTNPYDNSEAMILVGDENSDLWAVRMRLSGTTLNVASADGAAALETSLSGIIGRPFDFGFDPGGSSSKLTQDGYIFENDDEDQATSDAVDENTQQAGGNTAITGVKKGERITVRTHIKNTGGKVANNVSLFYDRSDGLYSQVATDKPVVTANGNCTSTDFDCLAPDNLGSNASDGQYTDVAIDPSGNPWISYFDATNTALKVAQYVGTGGNCSSGAWNCGIVDTIATNAGDGQFSSIAFDARGRPWVSYFDGTNTALKVATKGGGFGSACTDTAWTCGTVDTIGTNANDGKFSSLAFSPTGTPWISYHDGTNTAVKVAAFVGAGGTGCAVTTWTCSTVDTLGTNAADGQYTSIAFDNTGKPWISYFDGANTAVKVANYVGTGGGCATAWVCTTVDTLGATTDDGKFTSIAFDPSGNPWISYFDSGNTALRAATKDGGFGSTCTDATWTCAIVDTMGTNATDGQYTSIAFDAAGAAWISYTSGTDTGLKTARYRSSGGNCTSSSWDCALVDTLGSNASDGQHGAIVFAPTGNAYISYFDATNTAVKVANVKRSGELEITPGIAGATGDTLSESHADMSSATDTTERDTADCISGSTTWNSGKWFEQTEGSGVSLPAGVSAAQCTEVAFVIDTAHAVAGRTYRLLLASKDNWRSDRGMWRGPVGVASGAYITLTIESNTTYRLSKDSQPKFTDCSNSSWGCMDVDAPGTGVGYYSSVAMDSNDRPWISYYDDSSLDLKVARFVGTGGSGCGGAPAQWTCTTIDSTGNMGQYSSMAFDPEGTPWIGYIDRTSMGVKAARYVGAGGTGCASTAWTCITVDLTGGTDTEFASLAIDRSGNIWLAYFDFNADLKLAQYVGSGGTGCSNTTAWSCIAVEVPTNTVGNNLSLALDNNGNPWISYFDATIGDLRVARRELGNAASSGCAADWECTLVKGTGGYASLSTSISFDQTGTAYVAFDDATVGGFNLMVAKYVGSGGSNCTSSAWTCTTVDSTLNSGLFQSIATAPDGTIWIAHYSDPTANLNLARQKTGNAASGNCAANWECFVVNDTAQDIGNYPSMAFDSSGVPWISNVNDTSGRLGIAKLHTPSVKPTLEAKNAFRSRNASHGDARYRLDIGKSPRTESGTCSAITDNKGYCGTAADDSDFDSMASLANERPMYVLDNKSATNSTLPTVTWKGRSNIAPNTASTTGDIVLQVYKFGSTNAWTNVTTDSTSSNCSTADCTLTATLTGTASDYYELIDGSYWSYFRTWQYENSSTETLKTDLFTMASNTAPSNPGSLAQKKTNDTVLATGDWTSESSVKFTASISDPDSSDTLQLCVEKKALGVSFSNTEDSCGSGVSYSGSPVSASVTIGSLTDNEYHWQARVKDAGGLYSAWVSYDTNLESARDFGVDTTAPTGGIVYDGTSVGVDSAFNDGSLSQLSANWSGFTTTVSGLARYDYSIGTTVGGTNIKGWTSNGTATSVTASSLTLQTSQLYYVNVRAVDNAGNIQSGVSSDGQLVAPSLSFSVSPSSLAFTNLNASNSYTDTKDTTLTTSTNAYGGYVVRMAATSLLTSGATTIANFTGGAYAAPDSWQTGDTGFGYTSSDASIQGGNIFQATPCPGGNALASPGCYSSYSLTKPGDIIADHTTNVSGNPITNEAFTITHRLTVPATQAALPYSATLLYTITAQY